jgi:uncharacterized membrane protein YciS (DUF1049 family)
MHFGHIAPVVIVGLILGAFGWGVVYLSAKVEHQRARHRLERFGPPRNWPRERWERGPPPP